MLCSRWNRNTYLEYGVLGFILPIVYFVLDDKTDYIDKSLGSYKNALAILTFFPIMATFFHYLCSKRYDSKPFWDEIESIDCDFYSDLSAFIEHPDQMITSFNKPNAMMDGLTLCLDHLVEKTYRDGDNGGTIQADAIMNEQEILMIKALYACIDISCYSNTSLANSAESFSRHEKLSKIFFYKGVFQSIYSESDRYYKKSVVMALYEQIPVKDEPISWDVVDPFFYKGT